MAANLPHARQHRHEARQVLLLIKGLGQGGAEHLLTQSARLHDRSEWSIRVAYVLPWKDALVGELRSQGIPVTCLGARRAWDPSWTIALRRLLVSDPVSVVHTHSPLVAVGTRAVVRSLPRSRRPRLVYTEHNEWTSHHRATATLNHLTFSLDDAHLAVSEAVRASIPDRYRESIDVVHHGIERDPIVAASTGTEIRAEVRAELGARDSDLVVLTVANLRRTKGYPDLLRAARTVIDELDEVRFVAAGQGPMDAELTKLHTDLALGDRFRFLGHRSDVARLVSGADLFCMSSHQEGLPVAMMEALVGGLPIVATAVGGVPELVTDGVEADLVPAERPDLLAQSLERLLRDPGRRAAMSEAGRRRAESLSPQSAVERTEQIYARLVSE